MANSARIDELRKKFDENPRRYFAPLANEYRKSGDLDQAAFILEEYLPQQPGHMSGHIVYGQTLFELGRDEEAKRVFETALTLDPENLIALRHLGHIARQAGDFDSARSWYQRLLEADPRDAEIEQLLESLDSAAQAHAAAPLPSSEADASVPPPLPPPQPFGAAEESSALEVEHVVEQEAPTVTRPATHPLAPPPMRAPTPMATPIVEAAAERPAEAEELLDIADFSIGGEPATTSATPSSEQDGDTPAEAMPVADIESHSEAGAEGELAIVDLNDIGFDEHQEPAAASSTMYEAHEGTESPEIDDSEHGGAAAAIDFVPFSDLPPETVEASAENVSGLETYTFESSDVPDVQPEEDLGSFFMEPTEPMPAAPEATESHESLAGDATMSAPESPAEDYEEPATAPPPTPAQSMPAYSTPLASTPIPSTPAYSTPIASTPVASTPIHATPSVPASSMPGFNESGNEDDAFATETMAKLYVSQGHFESALGIYRTLAAKNPNDAGLNQQIAELEDRVQRRRREPTPVSPVESVAEAVSAAEEPVAPVSGPTIRDFLVEIIRRGVSVAPATASNGGSIDELFGGGGAMDDDLVAADTLAQAFAPEPDRDPMAGKPARQASSELSLDHVFREPGQTRAAEDASGFSFDQFFAGDVAGDSSGEKAPAQGDPDDIEQFNAWLNGLKKT